MKKFIKELEAQEANTQEYPFGSCQYETVEMGYLAAKAIGIPNLSTLFIEDDFIKFMLLKGKKETLLTQFKQEIIYGMVRPPVDQKHNEELWERVKLVTLRKAELDPVDYREPEDLVDAKAILDAKDVNELLEILSHKAYDLWSVPFPLPGIDLPEVITPDVGDGPLLNMMAWEEGYEQGVSMAVFEYLWEEDIDFQEWDT